MKYGRATKIEGREVKTGMLISTGEEFWEVRELKSNGDRISAILTDIDTGDSKAIRFGELDIVSVKKPIMRP